MYLVGGVHRVGDPKHHHDECPWQYYTSANRVVQERVAALKKTGSSDKVTVLMYEPAYEVRATNDKKADPTTGALDPQFHRKIMENSAQKHGYEVKFVRSQHEMLSEMGKISAKNPIRNGGYFGHSAPDKLLLNYGESAPPSGSADVATQYISANDFRNAGVKFHPDAHFTSYGCRQGEPGGMMEQLSKDQNIKTTGSHGDSLWQPIGQGYKTPRSQNGYITYPKPHP